MAYCIDCESSVESVIRKGSVIEPHFSRSATNSVTFGSRGTSTRTTFSSRTTWRRRSIKVPVCGQCGKDLRFPNASSAGECWALRNREQRDALIQPLLWTTFGVFAACAYHLVVRDYVAASTGWLKLGAYLGGMGVAPLVASFCLSFVISEYAPNWIVDVLVALSRRLGAAIFFTPLTAVAGFFIGRFVQPGTEMVSAMVSASIAAIIVLTLFVADVVRLYRDRQHLADLAFREMPGTTTS